jgi:hypothetical protein
VAAMRLPSLLGDETVLESLVISLTVEQKMKSQKKEPY